MSGINNLDDKPRHRYRAIIYWTSTGIIVLQTAAAAVLDLWQEPGFAQVITDLGYPLYVMTILGVWRVLAVIALVIPQQPVLKEWAYAGLFFSSTGAAASHFIMNNPSEALYPLAFTLILVLSWCFRPDSRALFSQLKNIQRLSGSQEAHQFKKSK